MNKGRKLSLADVKSGRIEAPIKMLIYGPDGVGKSTFASGAPKPLFLSFDHRTLDLEVDRVTPASLGEALQYIALLEREKHSYLSIVVDPVSWLETMIHEEVMGGPGNIDKWDGGYGRGATAALDHWRILLGALERLWTNGMNVVLVGHALVKRYDDPEGPAYDRFEISLKPNAAGRLKQWADYVFFARHETLAKKGDDRRVRGYATGARVMHTAWSAAYDAKRARTLPDELPLSWEAFVEAHAASAVELDSLKGQVAKLVRDIGDPEVEKRASAYVVRCATNSARLTELVNALTNKWHQTQASKETGT